MQENVIELLPVEFRLYGIELMLLVVNEPLNILRGIMFPVFVARIQDIVCNVIRLPQPVAVNYPEIDSMTDQLVSVILVAERSFGNLLVGKLFSYMEMDIPFLLLYSGNYAVEILAVRIDIFLRP